MSDFRPPAGVVTAEAKPWTCECGHGIKDHGRRVAAAGGYQEYTGCRADGCSCSLFVASDGSGWPYGKAA